MAVVLGTNCGFVSEVPVADPAGVATTTDGYARAIKHVAPVGADRITEIGWWCGTPSDEQNFEVGLYSHDAGNDKPGDRLNVDDTNAKGTTSGWKTVAVDWLITAGTIYWIAFQLDTVTGATKTDLTNVGEPSRVSYKPIISLTDPWHATSIQNAGLNVAVYALYEAVASYVDLAGTGGGIGGGSAILTTTAMIALAGTGGGVGGGSADLLVSGFPSGTGGVNIYKRIVVAGNDKIYYEDI